MDDKIFDVESGIMSCWQVTEDIKLTMQHFIDGPQFEPGDMSVEVADAIMNQLSAIEHLYQLRFQNLWEDFCEHTKEYHAYRKAVTHG
jgi:hypothetical protein